MGLLLIVNLHGVINSKSGVRNALSELKTERKFTATVVTDDEQTKGMLRACKDYLAWAPAEKELLSSLLEKRGMVSESKRLDSGALKTLGFKNYDELAEKMLKEEIRLSAVKGLRPFFRLSPPKGGFKRTLRRQATDRGTLGSNADLPQIVRRML
jgi:large subunit ribosomal protein L30